MALLAGPPQAPALNSGWNEGKTSPWRWWQNLTLPLAEPCTAVSFPSRCTILGHSPRAVQASGCCLLQAIWGFFQCLYPGPGATPSPSHGLDWQAQGRERAWSSGRFRRPRRLVPVGGAATFPPTPTVTLSSLRGQPAPSLLMFQPQPPAGSQAVFRTLSLPRELIATVPGQGTSLNSHTAPPHLCDWGRRGV